MRNLGSKRLKFNLIETANFKQIRNSKKIYCHPNIISCHLKKTKHIKKINSYTINLSPGGLRLILELSGNCKKSPPILT